MRQINPNLLAAAASPIMEAAGWVEEVRFPDNRPLMDLSQAAPRKPPPEGIRARLADAMLNEVSAHYYGAVLGNTPLREEIARTWSHVYEATIGPTQVAVTAGCNQAFCVAISSVAGPGDAVMLPFPWYFNHKMWLDMAGIDCVPLPVGADMLPDPEQAETLMSDRVKAIVLVTPNNPTGAEYPAPLMQAFLELAARRGALLIVDETYRDFHSCEGPPHGLFSASGWEDHFVHLYSFSKVYRIMGHRTGALIASADRIAQIEKMLDTMTICPAQSGQIAALHGLQTLGDWIEGERQEFRSRRDTLVSLFARELPDWTVHGAGAYFAWVTPPHGQPSGEAARQLVADCSLLVLPGAMFMPTGVECEALRIAFANVDRDGIAEMVSRLEAWHP